MQERAERYRLIRHLGRGGMGDVYLARLEATGHVQRLVAIKFLRGVDARGAPGLLREARLTALLSHPNLVHVVDAGVDADRPWFAMEFVAGLSLADLLEAAHGSLPPWVVARIVADLALGVHALHEATDERGTRLDIVHRDLSPHNVLVSWDGVVKLLDLGIARSQLQTTTTETGIVRGKLAYMSPEQAAGDRVDRRSDVFALGALLWESLAGRRLFQGDTEGELLARVIRGDVTALASVAPHAPVALSEIAHRALAKRPADRFATSLEMHRAIEVAMRASGVIVGAHEVGQALAVLVPDRVREHEGWLREADSAGPRAALVSKQGALAVSVTRDPRRQPVSGARRFQVAAVAVGFLFVAAVVGIGGLRVAGTRHDSAGSVESGPAGAVGPSVGTRSPVAPAPEPLIDVDARDGASVVALPAPSERANPESTVATALRPHRPVPALMVAPPPSARVSSSPGTLNIVASPSWATILLDGKVVGQTPLVLPGVSGGPHSIEARALGTGAPETRVVTVQPGVVTRVELSAQ